MERNLASRSGINQRMIDKQPAATLCQIGSKLPLGFHRINGQVSGSPRNPAHWSSKHKGYAKVSSITQNAGWYYARSERLSV